MIAVDCHTKSITLVGEAKSFKLW